MPTQTDAPAGTLPARKLSNAALNGPSHLARVPTPVEPISGYRRLTQYPFTLPSHEPSFRTPSGCTASVWLPTPRRRR